MKKQLLFLLIFSVSLASVAQVSSTDGTFSAAGTTNLGLRTNTTARLTILGGTGASAGFVGVNTIAPADWFHVNGNARANQFNSVSGIFNTIGTANLSFKTNNTARMTILNNNGYVGIGTNSPTNQLQIGPNPNAWSPNDLVVSNANGGLAINTLATDTYLWGSKDISIRPGNSGNASIYAKSDGTVGIGTATPNSAYKLDVAGTINATSILVGGQPIPANSSLWTSVGGNTYVPSGNIGIGTTTPGAKLSFGGVESVNADGITWSDYSPLQYGIFKTSGSWSGPDYQQLQLNWETGIILNPGLSSGKSYVDVQGNGLRVSTGNVIIGAATPNPAYKLDVAGTINATSILVGGQPISANSSLWTSPDGVNTYVPSGNIGIGTTTPSAKLSFGQIENENGGLTWSDSYPLNYGIFRTSGPWSAPDYQQLQLNWDTGIILNPGSSYGKSYVDVQGNGLRVSTGNVIIGAATPNPAYKLDVAGTINATSILVGGQPISGGGSSVWTNIGADINFLTGSVGIGKAPATGNKLDVDGAINSSSFFLNGNSAGQGDPTFTTRSAGTKLVLNPSLAAAAADYAFGTSANTLWSSVNTTSSSFKWFGGRTLAATLSGGGNLTLVGVAKANNLVPSSVNLTTAGATTTLTASSAYYQNSTVAQTIKLPVVTTLSNGHQFFIKNSGTQPVTVQTSAGTALQVMAANATLELTCVNTAGGTGTASWQWVYNTNTAGSPAASQWTTTGNDIAYNGGNVGIGKTPASGYKLDVAGTLNATSILVGGQPISTGSSQWTTTGSNISFGTGNVGIGSLASEAKLSVNLVNPSGWSGNLKALKISSPDNAYYLDMNTYVVESGNVGYHFSPNGNTGISLTTRGNVGIGNTNPQNKLDVNGTINVSATGLAAPPAGLGYGLFPHANVGIGTYSANGGISFWGGTTPTEYMRIMNGNVGIGTTNPSTKLEVNGDANIGVDGPNVNGYGAKIQFLGASSNSDPMWISRYNNGSNYSELRMNIGDDNFADDALTIGNFFSGDGQWKTFMKVQNNGNVGIGTTTPDAKLAVKGQVHAQEVKVDLSVPGPDYVFEKDYRLSPLDSIKTYIDQHKHLPEVPSAKEMEKNGVNLGEMNMLLLKKIEELTLHLIEMKKENEALKNRVEKIENRK